MNKTENEPKRSRRGQWRKGVSGNPSGGNGKGERTNLKPSPSPEAERSGRHVSRTIFEDKSMNKTENEPKRSGQWQKA